MPNRRKTQGRHGADLTWFKPEGLRTLPEAGVEVARSSHDETHSVILPIVPYVDTLPWVLIAAALGGIVVTVYARLDDLCQGHR